MPVGPDEALIRDRRLGHVYLARDIQTTRREVTFLGQLVLEDFKGVRLYPARDRRLTPARAEVLTQGAAV